MATRGTESSRASARPVTRLVAPARSTQQSMPLSKQARHAQADSFQGSSARGHSNHMVVCIVTNASSLQQQHSVQQQSHSQPSRTTAATHQDQRWRCTRPRGRSPWRSPQPQRSRPAARKMFEPASARCVQAARRAHKITTLAGSSEVFGGGSQALRAAAAPAAAAAADLPNIKSCSKHASRQSIMHCGAAPARGGTR